MGKHKHKKTDEERNEGGVQEDEVQEAKEADTSQVESETTKPYEELVTLMAPIAKPLASKKLPPPMVCSTTRGLVSYCPSLK